MKIVSQTGVTTKKVYDDQDRLIEETTVTTVWVEEPKQGPMTYTYNFPQTAQTSYWNGGTIEPR